MPNYENIVEAAKSGTVEDVKFFIEKMGDSARSTVAGGATLLHIAAESNRNITVLEYLISQDVNVKAKNNWGMTPLHYAAKGNDNDEVLKYLVSQGAEVKAEDENGVTPLHEAASGNGNIAVLEYLISQGADVNAKTTSGTIPLHGAAEKNPNFLVVRFLIAQGAEINAKDKAGKTPLDHACSAATYCREQAKWNRRLVLGYNRSGAGTAEDAERWTQEAKEYDRKCEVAEKKESVIREAGGQCGSGGSGSSGCLVFFVALGTLLTSGVCGLVFAIIGSIR